MLSLQVEPVIVRPALPDRGEDVVVCQLAGVDRGRLVASAGAPRLVDPVRLHLHPLSTWQHR